MSKSIHRASSPSLATTSLECQMAVILVVALRSRFIKTTLADVTDPLDHVVIAVVELRLKDLQVANFEARAGKGDLCVCVCVCVCVCASVCVHVCVCEERVMSYKIMYMYALEAEQCLGTCK